MFKILIITLLMSTTTLTTDLGNFTATHYCSCAKCCGTETGKTATGTQATAERTIAVDPEIIPLGSKVIINNKIYIAEDTGGAIKGNRIDIYCESHQEALELGVKKVKVYLIKEEK
ncbi:MAG: hypothetical protein EOM85_03350 [Candidatus Moranbacteria bacterium]|nr:hypothetical protein [Candidatus Moranbacteria bacterium]